MPNKSTIITCLSEKAKKNILSTSGVSDKERNMLHQFPICETGIIGFDERSKKQKNTHKKNKTKRIYYDPDDGPPTIPEGYEMMG